MDRLPEPERLALLELSQRTIYGHGRTKQRVGRDDPFGALQLSPMCGAELHVCLSPVVVGVTDLLLIAKMTPGNSAPTDGLSSPLVPAVFGLLDPGSLMGRLVVGHGDLHDKNLMRRQARGQAGDLVIIDFDRVMRMTAGYDFGAYLASHDSKPMDSGEKAPYPPLAYRLAAAQAYIDAIGPAECAKWSRATVEEV